MNKFFPLVLVSALAVANPKSIHYSSVGDYLVDENGKKTAIQGHPNMVCYVGADEEIHGKFQKARVVHPGVVVYLVGWSSTQYRETGKKETHYFLVPNPVCDLK